MRHIRATEIHDLSILPVGSAHARSASALAPKALRHMIDEASRHFDMVLIDTGPILGSIEASLVTVAADAVILTIARGQQRPLVEKSLGHLRVIGAKLAGVVFNRAQGRDFGRSMSYMSLRSVNRPGESDSSVSVVSQPSRLGPVARAVASTTRNANGNA